MQSVSNFTYLLQVIKSQYTGGAKTDYRGKEVMIVEEHTRCKCDCRIKEQDCNRFQRYDKSQCKCYCQNVDEQHKCLQVSLVFIVSVLYSFFFLS